MTMTQVLNINLKNITIAEIDAIINNYDIDAYFVQCGDLQKLIKWNKLCAKLIDLRQKMIK